MNIKRNVLLLGLFFSSVTLNIFSAEKSLPSLTLPDSTSDSAGEARGSDTKEKIETCSICLEDKTESDHYELGCDHDFHKTCITTWVNENHKSNCPLCRAELSPKNLRELGNSAADLRIAPRRGANSRQSIDINLYRNLSQAPPIQVDRAPHTPFYSHNRSMPLFSNLSQLSTISILLPRHIQQASPGIFMPPFSSSQASHRQTSRSGIAHDNPFLRDNSNDPHVIQMAQYDREHPVTIQDLITAGTAPDIDTRMFPGEAHLSFFDRITSLEGLQNFPRKDEVTHFSFMATSLHLETLPERAFEIFPNLKEILIHGSTLKSIKAGAFDGLPHLKKISIEFNSQLIDIEPGAFTNVAPQLEKINLKNNLLPEEVKRRIRDEVQAVSPRTIIVF